VQDISLLNSIIGPVMRGPSSSHSAAPYMIARTARELALGEGETLAAARIRFDPSGSFAQVYANQGSDEGFAAGLWGVELTSPDYRYILPRLKAGEGFAFDIEIGRLRRADHPNRVELRLTVRDAAGRERTDLFEGVSTGGGMFAVDALDGRPLPFTGTAHGLVVEGGPADGAAVTAAVEAAGHTVSTCTAAGPGTWVLEIGRPADPRTCARLREVLGAGRVRWCAARQYPVASGEVLFEGADRVLREVAERGGDLAGLALDHEARRLGVTAATARGWFEERLDVMLASVRSGLSHDPADNRMRFLKPTARRVAAANLPPGLGGDVLRQAIAGALAAMEQSGNREVVCAAPTAGSAGVVPGCLYALECQGVPRAALVDALQVMALVGAVFAARSTFAAEVGGCSVETGASAAMAAAGVAHVYGAAADQAFAAAAMCLMNTLGLVCDPVGGEVEIPCHARNIAGVAHVFSACQAVLAGFDAVLSFDDMVAATVEVAGKMHSDLRCTARGGCAATATGKCLSAVPRGGAATPRMPLASRD